MAKKRRPPLLLPAPKWSDRLYVRLPKHDIAMFRYLLEAQENLGYMSVVDCNAAVLKVVFSPHQEREMRNYLEIMRQTMEFFVLERPRNRVDMACYEQLFERMDGTAKEKDFL